MLNICVLSHDKLHNKSHKKMLIICAIMYSQVKTKAQNKINHLLLSTIYFAVIAYWLYIIQLIALLQTQ